jgi:signal transduction histidine kinase
MTDQHDDYDSELISLVTHELKTPVGAASGFLDLVEHTGELTEKQQYFIGRVRSSLARMEKLIAALLDYTRIHSGIELERSVVNIHALIDENLDLLRDIAAQRSITIHLQEERKALVALVDKRLLGHVISNFLSNAVKYNKTGGNVWVTVKEQGSTVRVDVRDDGIGINDYAQSRVFDRFYRAVKSNENGKIEGSGLGLAISQSIVDLHKGRIWLESKLGEGSTFSFTVPIQPEKETVPEEEKESAES